MNGPVADIWRAVSEQFGRLRGDRARDLWLREARPVSFRRGLFTLSLHNDAAKAAIDARYLTDIETILLEFTGSPVRVLTRVGENGTDGPQPAAEALPKRDTELPPTALPFVVTERNRMVYDAITAFADAPGTGFDLLFVHGPEGSGKTALMRHAFERLCARDADVDPLVLSGETLTQDVSRAARNGTLARLRRAWRGHGLVLLDEAHRLRGRARSQHETASMLAPLFEAGGRVLIMSRHAPADVHLLDTRLHSYFQATLQLELPRPATEDREAVLTALAATLRVPMDADVPSLVAARCPGTVADGVALLQRAADKVRGTGRAITGAFVEPWLTRPGRAAAGMDDLVRLVAQRTDVEIERIRSAEKSRPLAAARHLFIDLATRSLGISARQVCRYLRLSSPSVVAYAKRAVERRRHNEPEFDRLVHELQTTMEGAQRDLSW